MGSPRRPRSCRRRSELTPHESCLRAPPSGWFPGETQEGKLEGDVDHFCDSVCACRCVGCDRHILDVAAPPWSRPAANGVRSRRRFGGIQPFDVSRVLEPSGAARADGVLLCLQRGGDHRGHSDNQQPQPDLQCVWFASVVLATAGLFVLAGAPFLAAGTVIVYAGAIIVTFLFVIMLAQMEGKAAYDRAARAPGAATFSCFLLLWCLIYALSALGKPPAELPQHGCSLARPSADSREDVRWPATINRATQRRPCPSLRWSLPPGSLIQDRDGHDKPNVAGLGESLYTTHLVTVGLAGAAVRGLGRCRRNHQSQAACSTGTTLTCKRRVRLSKRVSFSRENRRLGASSHPLENNAMPSPDVFTVDVLRNYLLVGGALRTGHARLPGTQEHDRHVSFGRDDASGVALSLVGFGRYHGTWTGQVFTILMLTVAACEASIALALIVILYNQRSSLDVTLWREIREVGVPSTPWRMKWTRLSRSSWSLARSRIRT